MAVIETSEHETVDLLKTHYYKASYDQIKEAYLEVLKNLKHTVVSVNDDYHEIFSEVAHMVVTAKIIMQTPKETSIDFFINAEYLLGSHKKACKFIQAVLKYIESKYELKGLSLHK